MQIDRNAINLAVATKLSNMGQEWGWHDKAFAPGHYCESAGSHLSMQSSPCEYCGKDFKVPLDFCGSHEAFGRLVEYVLSEWYYTTIKYMVTDVLNASRLRDIPIKVALAQAFTAAKEEK